MEHCTIGSFVFEDDLPAFNGFVFAILHICAIGPNDCGAHRGRRMFTILAQNLVRSDKS
jgi:hypothetical protein